MRLEIIDRKRVIRVFLAAQFLVPFSLFAQDKPTLLVIGTPTGQAWKAVSGPAYHTRIVDRSAEPRLAEAYAQFAKLVGVQGDPLYVLVTQYMEPFAAATDPAFVDGAIADRERLTAEAGLTVRRHLLTGRTAADSNVTPEPDLQLFDRERGGFYRCAGCLDKLLADQARAALHFLRQGQAEIVKATLDSSLRDLQNNDGLFVAGVVAGTAGETSKPRTNQAIITAHNAAMISALARAAIAYDEPRYATAAVRAAKALKPQKLTVEDQALLTRALFDAYEASFDPSFLQRAVALQANATVEVPAPVAALVPKQPDVKVPTLDDLDQLIVAGSPSRQDTQDLLRAARKSGAFVVFVDFPATRQRLAGILPHVAEIIADDEPVAVVCNRGKCRAWAN